MQVVTSQKADLKCSYSICQVKKSTEVQGSSKLFCIMQLDSFISKPLSVVKLQKKLFNTIVDGSLE